MGQSVMHLLDRRQRLRKLPSGFFLQQEIKRGFADGWLCGRPPIEQRTLDGWGTVSSSVGFIFRGFHLPWVSSSVGFISRGSEAPVPDQEELALQAPGDATLIRKML
jgi:hypothetical protein